MISILAQERLLGAALGGVFVGAVIFEQRKGIYSSISKNKSVEKAQYEPKPILGKKLSTDVAARMWNKAVDGTLGHLVQYLSTRGW